MKNTLIDLYNGNLSPIKESGNTPEIKELKKLIEANSLRLSSTFNDRQNEIFENYNTCIEEYIMYSNEEAFCSGLSLGIKILIESL